MSVNILDGNVGSIAAGAALMAIGYGINRVANPQDALARCSAAMRRACQAMTAANCKSLLSRTVTGLGSALVAGTVANMLMGSCNTWLCFNPFIVIPVALAAGAAGFGFNSSFSRTALASIVFSLIGAGVGYVLLTYFWMSGLSRR